MNWNIWVEIATRTECPARDDTNALDSPVVTAFAEYLHKANINTWEV